MRNLANQPKTSFTSRVTNSFASALQNFRRRRYYDRKLSIVENKASAKDVFETIYEKNLWNSAESRSGPGSEIAYTAAFREALAEWLARHQDGITTFFDAPCGDFNWMRLVELPDGMRYIGGDIVAPLIAQNNASHAGDRRRFIVHDIAEGALPDAEAWLCRDVLFHLPYAMGVKAIERFHASKAEWFLSTTFPGLTKNNHDIPVGHYRPVNLALAPYDLGPPEELLLDDMAPEPQRFIGVWRNKA